MRWLTPLFVLAVLASLAIELWLSQRQGRAVARHRDQVPGPFADSVSASEHRKAADYTLAKLRLGRIGAALDAALTLGLTVGGGVAALDALWRHSRLTQPWLGVLVIGTVALLMQLANLPLSVLRAFLKEKRFGFNRTTPALFLADLGKNLALAVLLGGPLLLATLVLMERAGGGWWVWAWGLWLTVMFLMVWAWPAFIAPLFNRFSPLEDQELRQRIEALLTRCGFASRGVFVVDNSRRSTHGNAYFTGIGRHKRIVFFDTLLERLAHPEVEAVLAHELGHFRLKHVRQRLLLFVLVVPAFTFFITPLASLWSRRHEFQADAFATCHASAAELATALVKLHRDNASTLTPDPVYAAFYYSHPPPLARIARLRASGAAPAS